MAAMFLALLAALLLTTQRASAADVTGGVTTNTTVNTAGHPGNPPQYEAWERVRMEMTWAVQPGQAVTSGDHFTIPVDPNLDPASFIPFTLRAPDGQIVANAEVVPAPAPGHIRFVFTDYVNTHGNLSGTAFLELSFDQSKLDADEPWTDLEVYGTTLRVNSPGPGPDGTTDYKYGYWRINQAVALERHPVTGVLVNTDEAQIRWGVQFMTRVGGQDWSSVTIVDTPVLGSEFACPDTVTGYRAENPGDPWTVLPASRVNVVDCASDRLEVTLTKQADDHGIFRLEMNAWIATNPAGQPVHVVDGVEVTGFPPNGFTNTVSLNYEGKRSVTHTTTLRRANQGGDGSGIVPPVTPPTPPTPPTAPPPTTPPPTPRPPTRTVLGIRKIALTRNPRAGTLMHWRIEVRNRGRIAARNVRICDPLPRALTLTRTSVRLDLVGRGRTVRTTARVSMVRGQACITVRTLAVGQTARFTLPTRVAVTTRGALRNPVNAAAANANRVAAAARAVVRPAAVAGAGLPAVTG